MRSAVLPESGYSAMPMLGVAKTSLVPISYFSDRTSSSFCAAAAALPASPKSSRQTTNSSPPQRPMKSPIRRLCLSRFATSQSRASPMSWPSVSLIDLKRSRLMTSAASGAPLRWLRPMARDSCSRNRLRSARPVSSSYCARRSSSEVRCVTSVMSRKVIMPPMSSPLPSYKPWPFILKIESGCSGVR